MLVPSLENSCYQLYNEILWEAGLDFTVLCKKGSRSQWPSGLRRRTAAARLLRMWVRITSVGWMSVCCVCCVFSVRGLCVELITRPEESYRMWCVVLCDL